MTIKQIGIIISQVMPEEESTLDLTVKINGNSNTVFPKTDISDPITFDVDVPDYPSPEPTFDPLVLLENSQAYLKDAFVILPVELSCSNGAIVIANFTSNFNGYYEFSQGTSITKSVWVTGSADKTQFVDIVSQPLWNGVAKKDRYDIEYNQGPAQVTGPGALYLAAGETATFDIKVPKYNS